MVKGNIAPPKESFIQNGKKLVPTRYIPVIEVTRENIMDTIIKDGFHTYKEVFNY
jgi:ABC-type xylose transport system substrate-binding protein